MYNNCRIYTIDYDGDPTSDTISKEEWLNLKKQISKLIFWVICWQHLFLFCLHYFGYIIMLLFGKKFFSNSN
jgi:hypothetical protein